MDVLDALSAIESQILESPWIPLANRRAVDRSTLDRLILATRQEIERMQQTPPSGPRREEILSLATNESRLLLEEARRQADETLRDDRIKLLARQRFDEIVGEGKHQANLLIQNAYAYSAERISEMEQQLAQTRQQVGESLEILEKGIKATHKATRQRKKETAKTRKTQQRSKIG